MTTPGWDPALAAVKYAATWEDARKTREPIVTQIAARAEELRLAVAKRLPGTDPNAVIAGAMYALVETLRQEQLAELERAGVAQRDATIKAVRAQLNAHLDECAKRRPVTGR